MSHNTQPTGCVLCPIYRPDRDPRPAERPHVCTPHRERLTRDLHTIADMHTRLVNPDQPDVDDRWYQHNGRNGHTHWQPADPLSPLGGAAPVAGRTNQPHVGGTKDRPAPTNLNHVDLTAPSRPASIDIRYRGNWAAHGGDPDQIGHLSIATELDAWVRDWRDSMWPDHHLPAPTIPNLVGWLANRVDHACDAHPAVDEFADKMRSIVGLLRAALGETDPRPALVDGVTCRHCDTIALYRQPGDDYAAECGVCGLLYTDEELATWIKQLAAHEQARLQHASQ